MSLEACRTPTARPSLEAIRAGIAASPADHMMPFRIVYADETPRLANVEADLVKLMSLSV